MGGDASRWLTSVDRTPLPTAGSAMSIGLRSIRSLRRSPFMDFAPYVALTCDDSGGRMALPPFINSTGLIGKIFEKIQQAKVPPRYTTDFQTTVLRFGSGSARHLIPLLTRLGFIKSDGTPTELYTPFRNADDRKS